MIWFPAKQKGFARSSFSQNPLPSGFINANSRLVFWLPALDQNLCLPDIAISGAVFLLTFPVTAAGPPRFLTVFR
jgi:hypothetical protein